MRQADRLEQDRDGHLATAVNAEIQDVFRIEFEIKPGATVRNNPRREQQLAGTVGLTLIVFKKHAGRAMQLGNNDALGSVDNERTRGRHERNLAHVQGLIFLNFLHRTGVTIKQREAHLGAQRASESQAALLALLDVESRLTKHELNKVQPGVSRVGNDRKN